ncbi:MAG: ArsA family ATPase [Acidimicrobiales bacterium]
MDPSDFFTASRVLIVAGKGGVGKTTVAASLGLAASRIGTDTLLVEVEGKRGLGSMFADDDRASAESASDLAYVESVIRPADPESGRGALRARTISAKEALLDYLDENGLRGFGRNLTRLQVLDTLAGSTPGLKDLIVLGKIKQLEVARDADLIIIDAPASGHALSFLRAAHGLQQTVDTGPIARQADEVVDLLTDPSRTSVVLVTLAEETPVNELVETAYALEDEIGVRLGPAVVNSLFADRDLDPTPDETKQSGRAGEFDAAAQFWETQVHGQRFQVSRLASELPLEQIELPRKLVTRLGASDLEDLASAALDQISGLRFETQQ